MKYSVSTILVVLLVALAGCSGATTDGSDGADEDPTETAASTATPTGTATPADPGTTGTADPPTTSDLSLSDGDERLREAGSFTTEWTYTLVTADGATTTITDTYQVDLEANRSLERFSTSGPDAQSEFDIFVADGTSYARYGDGEQSFYQVSDQSRSVFEAATGRASGFTTYIEDDSEFVGTETFDGETVSRYEYTDLGDWRQYNQGLVSGTFGTEENVTVTDFEITALVDGNNVARLTTWTLVGETESGQTVSVDWRFSLTDVGSTTVADPDWLGEAQAQAA